MAAGLSGPFWARRQFLFLRLHSLTGLAPVGAYMIVHLLTNASVLNGASTFQRGVYQIHSLGAALPLIEWAFIFLPILFHAVIGVVIVWGGVLNTAAYPYLGNIRYTLQRITGLIAFAFLIWHVFHMHGWCHWDAWLDRVAEPLGGAQFRPYNAASSLHEAMRGVLAPAWYAAGVLCCIFHLANGIWTMGITWGVWTRPAAQRRADWLCLAFAAGLAVVGTGVLAGALGVDVGEALQDEQRMFDARAAAGEIKSREAAHKRWTHEELQRLHETVLGGGVVAAVEHAPGVAAPAAASWPRANRTGGER